MVIPVFLNFVTPCILVALLSVMYSSRLFACVMVMQGALIDGKWRRGFYACQLGLTFE